jgi:hypothetical protein
MHLLCSFNVKTKKKEDLCSFLLYYTLEIIKFKIEIHVTDGYESNIKIKEVQSI